MHARNKAIESTESLRVVTRRLSRKNDSFQIDQCCYYHFCSRQEIRLSLLDQDVEKGKQKIWMSQDKNIHQKKATKFGNCGKINDRLPFCLFPTQIDNYRQNEIHLFQFSSNCW